MPILCFHHIGPGGAEFDVTPEELADLLEHLVAAGTEIVPPSVAPSGSDDRVSFIFDDGYASTLEHALPLMEKFGVSFGMAVVPGLLSDEERPSWLPHSSTEFTTVKGVRNWLEAGGELLGHSYSHVKLTALATSTVRFELTRELDAYRGMGVPRPQSFAYPFGDQDDRVRAVVAEAGYRTAFGTGSGDGSPFNLHRITFRRWKLGPILERNWPYLVEEEND